MKLIKEFFQFAKERKKLWMIPLMLFMLIFGLLIVVMPNSAFAPYIYTFF